MLSAVDADQAIAGSASVPIHVGAVAAREESPSSEECDAG